MKRWTLWPLLLLLPLAACGGSGSTNNGGGGGGGNTPPPNNVLPVVSNLGVTNNYANGLFASVTICEPGSTNCQTIDNVLVDTGSYGLRLLASQVNLSLPGLKAPSGDPLGECLQYVSTFNWGPVVTADVKLSGEEADGIPIQLLGQNGFPAPPSDCTNSGSTETDTQADLGANGVLGLGVFRYDCGQGCAPGAATTPSFYFACPSAGCTATLVDLQNQVQNPVWRFAQDNNGILISLPSVPDSGALSVPGTVTFGIGTETNNAMNGLAILDADGFGDFDTVFQGNAFQGSVLDSGSNANFFLDDKTLSLPLCASPNDGFYCPGTTVRYQAVNAGVSSGDSATATWNVANANNLFNTGNAAFNNLAGPNPNAFDFGLSFFFGHTIYIGLNGASASNNGQTVVGPFYAY
jgi:hypothetical protein